ncbi:MAG: hypothetical protein P4N59_01650 [Negativicutes bacterium]|nr:hypothetical protein [Negativicutes bacterium]
MDQARTQAVVDIRRQIFALQIDAALGQTATLIEALLTDGGVSAAAVNRVAMAIMAAVEQRDYLLFADLVYFEIPALGQTRQGDLL